MRSVRIAALMAALVAISSLAHSDGISPRGFISDGMSGGISTRSSTSAPPAANFRITNIPDFRITNTGDFRIVASGAACGTGVIDTSAGCPLPMMGL